MFEVNYPTYVAAIIDTRCAETRCAEATTSGVL